MVHRKFFAANLISSTRKSIKSGLNRRGLSNRALIVGIILFALAVTLAPPIQHYFTQRAQINSLRTQITDNQKMLDNAATELAKWNDPEYVASQARARLHLFFQENVNTSLLEMVKLPKVKKKQKYRSNFQ
ncbi:hypothetical protein EMGBS2_02210 [Actinomycetota bacterium]|nr:hypothetical protein EMGBS2_02210 [Actinomycetota bacterium]